MSELIRGQVPMTVRVLMVDDDSVHLELSERFLTRQSPDYEIITVETSEEAIKLLDDGGFDAVVCDLDLAEDIMNGLDLLEQIRSSGGDVPVIIFTGKSREEFAIRALNLGADYYIRKTSTNVEGLYAELSYYILTAVEKRKTKVALLESQSKLRDSEARLAEAQRIAHFGSWVWNIEEDREIWSDEIYRIFGLAPQEFSATYEAFLESVHPDDRNLVKNSVDAAIHKKEPYNIDHRIIRPDGIIRYVHEEGEVTYDEQGKPVRMMGTVLDITDRNFAEKVLMDSRESFKELYNNALIGLFRVRISDGMILECNDQFAKVFSFENRQVLIDSSSLFKDFLLSSDTWSGLKSALKEHERLVTELAIKAKDGQRLWMRFSLRMWSEKGYIEGVMSDITQQKLALEMLRKQKEELSDFAHTMSHDLKNIFQNMVGFIELIEDENDFTHLKRLQSLIFETSELVDHSVALADAGLIVEEKLVEVNLDHLVRTVAGLTIPESIEYIQDTLPVIRADEMKITQIFRNLLDNAVKHGQPTKIEVKLEERNGNFCIMIANNGKEIPETIRAKLFLKGFTTSKSGQGFGLTIVKRIMDAHDWIIQLTPSRKTTFELIIPKKDTT